MMSEIRFVYVLRSQVEPARHYVGAASDVPRRVQAHNRGESKHTSQYAPWLLLAAFEFSTQEVALDFERYLKSGSGRAFARRHFG